MISPPLRRHAPSLILALACFTALALIPATGTMAAALFLLFGGSYLLLKFPRSALEILRAPAMAIAAYCLLSTAWSDHPAQSLRSGALLCLTMAIGTVFGGRLPLIRIAQCFFFAFLVTVLASIAFGRISADFSVAWIGLFGSKNIFALYGVMLLLCTLALWHHHHSGRSRLALLVVMGLCGIVILRCQSVGTLVSGFFAVSGYLFLTRLGGFTPRARLSLLLISALIALALLLYVVAESRWLTTALQASGKDPTLTGRTQLWAVALAYIAENPLFGTGYRAFWVWGNSGAEELWAAFHITNRYGFHFHNFYLSNAVELGLVGLTLECALFFTLFLRMLHETLARPAPDKAWAMSFLILMLVRSLVEVDLFSEFETMTFLCAVFFAHLERERRWRRAAPPAASPLSPHPAQG